MPITQILLTVDSGEPAPPPFSYGGVYYWNGITYSYLNNTGFSPSRESVTLPGGANIATDLYSGSQGLWTQPRGSGTFLEVDIWFLPNVNGVSLLIETEQAIENTGYHTSLIEIDNSGYVKARSWPASPFGGMLTSTNPVILNAWNHIYFRHNGTTAKLELNGVSQMDANYVRTPPASTSYFAISGSDTTNMGNSNRFNGRIGYIAINSNLQGSTYNAFKTSYQGGAPGIIVHNGVPYTLTPSTNGIGNPYFALPGNQITWTIDSAPSQAGNTIIWWVDANSVPVSTWVENPSYLGNANAGSVTLDANGSATWSLTVVNPRPTSNLFRLYIGDTLYNGFLTHGWIGM